MPSLESLPADQRAVLQLVLSRGRSYDEIARLLSIDRSAVRNRALAAARAIGPDNGTEDVHQGQVVDYLLGQVDDPARADAHELLAGSDGVREWASAVASELTPLATGPLPAIPERGASPVKGPETTAASPTPTPSPAAPPPPTPTPGPSPPPPTPSPPAPPPPPPTPPPEPAPASADDEDEPKPKDKGRRRRRGREKTASGEAQPRSSRLGGMILIVVSIAAIAVIVILLVRRNSTANPPPASTPTTQSTPAASSTSTSTSSATSASSTTTTAKPLASINLSPPPGSHSKAAAIAEILSEGSADGIAIVAQGVPPNKTHPPDAYAVWLYNSPTDAHLLGFVNPGVGSSGKFSTATTLPANAKHYHEVLVTVETSGSPKKPGKIILEGPLTGL
ncbi:MAG: RNA polymerase sigma factor [Solirubrobacteraceae bacterium]